MRKTVLFKKNIHKTLCAALLSGSIIFSGANVMAKGANYKYLPGDFHQHSFYTDGSQKFTDMMFENNIYLEWWANSEHGGAYPTDGEGVSWTDKTEYPINPIKGDNPNSPNEPKNMYRWQSLSEYAYPQILEARGQYSDKTIISGLEWNVPGHEHCSTAIYQPGTDIPTAISEFEYRFDKSDKDNSRNGEAGILGDTLSKTNNSSSKADALTAITWMENLHKSGKADAWVVPAHVERQRKYTIEDFRKWMDAGPDVAVGFEGQPGHQPDSDARGGFGSGAVGGGTYGGSGVYVAKIGGLWDGLSAEGRKYFNFASSDCHSNWSYGGGDFWPGEYQKDYTYINVNADDKIQAVFDGIHSGNSWTVMGDLIDELEFTAKSKNTTAMMGQTLKVKKGDQVQIKIKVHDPAGPNNCPLDMDNPSLAQVGISQPLSKPVLDHIDLISGSITGNIPPTNLSNLEATDYGTDAAVMETFKRNGGADKDGYMTYVINIKVKNSMFLRLRGTNLPAGVPYETDADGNPLCDTEATAHIYGDMDNSVLAGKLFSDVAINTDGELPLKEVAAAYADLWFYSNPIYIEVVK